MKEQYNELLRAWEHAITADSSSAVDKIADKITSLQHAALYAACVRHLKNRGGNQFAAAANYTDAACCGKLTPDQASYEISGLDTKSGNPVVIWF